LTDDEIFEFWYLAGKVRALRILDSSEARKWDAWEKDDRINYALHLIIDRKWNETENFVVHIRQNGETEIAEPSYTQEKKSQIDRLYDKIQDNDWLADDYEQDSSSLKEDFGRSCLGDPYPVYDKIVDIRRFTATKDVVLPKSIRLCIELDIRDMHSKQCYQRKITLHTFFN